MIRALDTALAAASLIASAADPCVVKQALAFMGRLPTETRARLVSALARAFVHAEMCEDLRADAVLAMTMALDDPSLIVRRTLAEALASAAGAPRHIVLSLAADRSEVASIVVALSPLLDDAALCEAVQAGDGAVQTAAARRAGLGPRTVYALADIGERGAVLALAGNGAVVIGGEAQRRLFERFADDAQLRRTLFLRANLIPALRVDLADAEARAVGRAESAGDPRRAAHIARERREAAFVAIARACRESERDELVDHLRQRGLLTPALLLRALLSGERGLFETALSLMSGAPPRRAAGFVKQWRGQGFQALYLKCALPEVHLPVFRAALGALELGFAPSSGVSHALTLKVIEACEAARDPSLAPAISMLWRLAGESARHEARLYAAQFAAEAAPFEEAEPERPSYVAQTEPASATEPSLPLVVLEAPAPVEIAAPAPAEPAVPKEPVLDDSWLEILKELESPELDPMPKLPAKLDFHGANENYVADEELLEAA